MATHRRRSVFRALAIGALVVPALLGAGIEPSRAQTLHPGLDWDQNSIPQSRLYGIVGSLLTGDPDTIIDGDVTFTFQSDAQEFIGIRGFFFTTTDPPEHLTIRGDTSLTLTGIGSNKVVRGAWAFRGNGNRIDFEGNVDMTLKASRAYGLLAGSEFAQNATGPGVITVAKDATINIDSYNYVIHPLIAVAAVEKDSYAEIGGTLTARLTGDASNVVGVFGVSGGDVLLKGDLAVDATAYAKDYLFTCYRPETWPTSEPAPTAIGIAADRASWRWMSNGVLVGSLDETTVTVEGNSTLRVTGDVADGIRASGDGRVSTGGTVDIWAFGQASDAANLQVANNIDKLVGGGKVSSQAVGIRAKTYGQGGGFYEASGEVTIHALEGEEVVGAFAEQGGGITLRGGFIASGDNDSFDPTEVHALYATGSYADPDLGETRTSFIRVHGDGVVNRLRGDVLADNRGEVSLNLDSGASFLLGHVNDAFSTVRGEISLSLNDDARWTNLGDSVLTSLTLNNGGLVDMTETTFNDKLGAGVYQKITTDKFSGASGLFIMDTDLQSTQRADRTTWDQHSDQLTITGAVNGTDGQASLSIRDKSLIGGWFVADDDLYKSLLVTDFSKQAAFESAVSWRDGLYTYLPVLEMDNDADANRWYLVNFTAAPVGPTDPLIDVPSKTAAALFSNWRWWNTTDTLLKRLGELRYANNHEDGLWTRAIHFRQHGHAGLDFNSYSTIVQIGADKVFDDREGNSEDVWRLGGAIHHGRSYTSIASGESEMYDYGATLYATYIGEEGDYLDLVVKGDRMRSRYSLYDDTLDFRTDTVGFRDDGSLTNWGFTASVETGHKYALDDIDRWFIEPQAQMIYGHLWGDNARSNKGYRIIQDDIDSLVGRIGAVLSLEGQSAGGFPCRGYVKASALYEFFGTQNLSIRDWNDVRVDRKDSLDGLWFDIGAGGNFQVTDDFHVYFDVEGSIGKNVEVAYKIEGGLRYTF